MRGVGRRAVTAVSFAQVGSNSRKAAREADSVAKDAERRRRDAEKAKLMADEEAETSGIKTTKKKSGKKKGDDISALLQAGLKNAPKSKFEKQQAAKKKEKEARRKQQAEEEAAAATRVKREEDLLPPLEQNLNHLALVEGSATGVDAALDVLAGGGVSADPHPEKRRKALYKAFEEKQLPILREDHPGLKLSQYKERIFDLWKKSPENPANQPPPAAAAAGGGAHP